MFGTDDDDYVSDDELSVVSVSEFYSIIITVILVIAVLGLVLWCKIRNYGYQRFVRDVTAASK